MKGGLDFGCYKNATCYQGLTIKGGPSTYDALSYSFDTDFHVENARYRIIQIKRVDELETAIAALEDKPTELVNAFNAEKASILSYVSSNVVPTFEIVNEYTQNIDGISQY